MARLPMCVVAGLLLAPVALGLGGCGFSPVYATAGHQTDSVAAESLSAIHVPVMPERAGMLMRQALQDRLERFGSKPAAKYELSAPYSFRGDIGGIDPNSNITRLRYLGTANWVLLDASTHEVLTRGLARTVSGADVFDSQFFSNELQSDAIQRHLADELADQIIAALASYFAHPPTQAAKPG